MDTFSLAVLIIAIALVFDYINGFHDAANSIATIVATRVLTPMMAVAWAAFFNFIAAFSFGTGVARAVAEGFVNLDLVTPYVVMAGLIGAIAWDLITWYMGLPTSSSHALIGGFAGAALARVGQLPGHTAIDALVLTSGGKWPATLLFIVLGPLIGLLSAYLLMVLIYWLFRGVSPARMDKYFRKLQLVSAALFSYSHGTGDAQKTMGIITAVLVTSGYLKEATTPVWVIFSAHAAIALGTLSGGWRIVRTMGGRLTRLKPRSGFCAETGGATAVLIATEGFGLPVSTTHAIAGAIAGVGTFNRMKAVRWGLATTIVWAWVMTIPAAAGISWISFRIIKLFVPTA
jgi:inorganic phosphate transporter, PiT family